MPKLEIEQSFPPGALLYDGEKITHHGTIISTENDATGATSDLISPNGKFITAAAHTPGTWRLITLSYWVTMRLWVGSATTMEGDFLSDADRIYLIIGNILYLLSRPLILPQVDIIVDR